MAGSGKTTLLQRINTYLHEKGRPGYLLNLDPAVADTPYEPNIDIRDTVRLCELLTHQAHSSLNADARARPGQVNYKNVMKQYGLGPNGGILTSLNLFATKFDQVHTLDAGCPARSLEACTELAPILCSLCSAGHRPVHQATAATIGAHCGGHPRADRDLHLVGVWGYHHGGLCVQCSDNGGLHHRHPALPATPDIHEQHAAGATCVPQLSVTAGRLQWCW